MKNQIENRSYRNRKSHEILGYLVVNLRVLELIFGRGGGIEHTPLPQIGLNKIIKNKKAVCNCIEILGNTFIIKRVHK